VKIKILPQALEDLLDGYHFYEERQAGLGSRFLTELLAEIDGLRIQAGIHRRAFETYFVKHARRFPYSIYYYIASETVMIDAVIDQRCDPDLITERLS
jgi:plasmid stabilization system protein ParE